MGLRSVWCEENNEADKLFESKAKERGDEEWLEKWQNLRPQQGAATHRK